MEPHCGNITHPPRTSLCDLPDELILKILADSSLDGHYAIYCEVMGRFKSPSTRCGLMLVNRRLKALVSGILYRHVEFGPGALWAFERCRMHRFDSFARPIKECPQFA